LWCNSEKRRLQLGFLLINIRLYLFIGMAQKNFMLRRGDVCLLVQEPDTYSSAFASIALLISIRMMAFCAYATLLASVMLRRFAVS